MEPQERGKPAPTTWDAWSARLDPKTPSGRRLLKRALIASGALGVLICLLPALLWIAPDTSLLSEATRTHLRTAILIVAAAALCSRDRTLRPIGVPALCALPVLIAFYCW